MDDESEAQAAADAEMDEFLKHFSLLKSREKLAEQDKIWRDICHILKWEFIRSV